MARPLELQRRHFVWIASVLRQYRDSEYFDEYGNVFSGKTLAEDFARHLASTNYRFNRETFLKACGH